MIKFIKELFKSKVKPERLSPFEKSITGESIGNPLWFKCMHLNRASLKSAIDSGGKYYVFHTVFNGVIQKERADNPMYNAKQ